MNRRTAAAPAYWTWTGVLRDGPGHVIGMVYHDPHRDQGAWVYEPVGLKAHHAKTRSEAINGLQALTGANIATFKED